MNLLIQHEWFQEVLKQGSNARDVEQDAMNSSAAAEKCYTDEDMWAVHQQGNV
jgi:hypothetical protein